MTFPYTVDVNHITMNMDEVDDNLLVHDSRQIYVYGSPRVVRGKHNNAISLNGQNQFLDAGQKLVCEGSLEECQEGFTARFQVNPNQLKDNTYFLSSAPLDIYYKGGRIITEFRTRNRTWQVSSRDISSRSWNLIETSWDPTEGISLFTNGVRRNSTVNFTPNRDEYRTSKHFYVGRANTDMQDEKYLDGVVDDLELWQATRNYLVRHGLVNLGELQEVTTLFAPSFFS